MTLGLFKDGYELWRSTETRNEYGGVEYTWNKQADIRGRATPVTAEFKRTPRYSYSVIQWRFSTTPDMDMQPGDEIRFNGRRLSVDVVPETSTGRRLEAECRELR
ncbi:phage head completion protein [Spectribacter hydrogenooxidans]|uniref:Head-tail adaptor protein n=1 Tax=Spectribacter hydrogenoxidans TaxID=3075608 RepID=A0ABU3C0G9_9GAMM|nr:head-tail adaptor protein [Salinisphaera sp. W335]MDT0635050.1 hypothetical protein [Salinisphaera sp. W335]